MSLNPLEQGFWWMMKAAWVLISMVLISGALLYMFFNQVVIFRFFGIPVGIYGFVVFFINIYDLVRASQNVEFVNERKAEAIEALKDGSFDYRISIQDVGIPEATEVVNSNFQRIREMMDRNPRIMRYLLSVDGNTVNRQWNAGSSDAIEREMARIFSDAPVAPPPPKPGKGGGSDKTKPWWQFILDIILFVPGVLYKSVVWVLARLVMPLAFVLRPLIKDHSGQAPIFLPIVPMDYTVPETGEGDASYLAYIAMQQFGIENVQVVKVDFNVSKLKKLNYQDELKLIRLINSIESAGKKIIILYQPHAGKRHAMFAASNILIRLYRLPFWKRVKQPRHLIFFKDLDTVVEPQAAEEMAYMFYTKEDEAQVGAVTGDVRIYNVTNWITFFQSLRYRFAFKTERASQSRGPGRRKTGGKRRRGYVTCVSGPLGLYDAEDLSYILPGWISDKFFGEEMTFGDDRGATNALLALGRAIIFTHLARAWTDAPELLPVWKNQQKRWRKSWMMYFIKAISSLNGYDWYLRTTLVYHVFFPILLAIALVDLTIITVYDLVNGLPNIAAQHLLIFFGSLLLGNLAKGITAAWQDRKEPPDPQGYTSLKFLLMPIYSLIHVRYLELIHLEAIIDLPNRKWGTPLYRKDKFATVEKEGGSDTLV